MKRLIAVMVVTVLLVGPSAAAAAAYDPALIVANIDTDCPVPNVKYPPEQFSTDKLIATFTPLATAITDQTCQSQATSLAVCALDGSLGIQSGCCSTGCSQAMAQLKNANCFPVLLKAVCTLSPQQQAQAQPFLPILATVAQRCADYQAPADVTCPDGSKITAGAAPAAAGAGNSSAGAAGNNTGAAGSTSFPTIAAALQAANGTDSNITTFIAAVESAGLLSALNDTTAWTILAPTNEAINATLATLNLTPAALLGPENKPLVTSILSHHVIPAGAVTAANLTDGMSYATLLPGANLTAHVNGTNVTFSTPEGVNGSVVTPDIMAGQSVVHIIDAVLVPPMDTASMGAGAAGGNMTMGAGGANETMGGGAAGAAPAPAAANTTAAPVAAPGAGRRLRRYD